MGVQYIVLFITRVHSGNHENYRDVTTFITTKYPQSITGYTKTLMEIAKQYIYRENNSSQEYLHIRLKIILSMRFRNNVHFVSTLALLV